MTIKAKFDGAEREFHIKDPHLFEATLPGGSAYAMLKKFTDGQWSAIEVAHILSFALHGPSREARLAWSFTQAARRHGLPGTTVPYVPHPEVVAAVDRDGPGNVAPIAVDILTEIVFREVPADAA